MLTVITRKATSQLYFPLTQTQHGIHGPNIFPHRFTKSSEIVVVFPPPAAADVGQKNRVPFDLSVFAKDCLSRQHLYA